CCICVAYCVKPPSWVYNAPPFLGTKETPTIPQDDGGNLESEHLRPGGRPDSTIRLQAMLLLPTHDSRLSLRPITTISRRADLLLNLLNRGPVLRPIPGMHRATAILRVIEVALRQRVRGGLGRLLPLPLQPILF